MKTGFTEFVEEKRMAFATKKDAQQWAADYLTAAENPGEYIDPIRGGQVDIIKRGKLWTFPGGDDWIDEVEALAPAA